MFYSVVPIVYTYLYGKFTKKLQYEITYKRNSHLYTCGQLNRVDISYISSRVDITQVYHSAVWSCFFGPLVSFLAIQYPVLYLFGRPDSALRTSLKQNPRNSPLQK